MPVEVGVFHTPFTPQERHNYNIQCGFPASHYSNSSLQVYNKHNAGVGRRWLGRAQVYIVWP